MFFEGAEKKVTLSINNPQISLRQDFDDAFWQQVVAHCQAHIISKIENSQCTAYLLSESSLFVWDQQCVIVTCGETSLIKAIEFLTAKISVHYISQLIFQRKNEYLSHAQPSNFFDDIKTLQQTFNGVALRFGALDSHHNYLYHLQNSNNQSVVQPSIELLAYQISTHASAILCQADLSPNTVRAFLQLEQLIPGFQLDDHVFSPYGYSLNAIKDHHYFTIHITPQENSSYVSVETNINLLVLTPLLLSILEPASFDLIAFNQPEFEALTQHYIPKNYLSKELVQSDLSSGEQVNFANYVRPTSTTTKPLIIDMA